MGGARFTLEDLPPHMRADAARQLAGTAAPAPTGMKPPAAPSFRVEHPGLVPQTAAKPNKYRNRKVEFEGQKYDSELELEMCQSFQARWVGNPLPTAFPKDVLWYVRQVKFVLEGGVSYIADAVVVVRVDEGEHRVEVWDAKGLFLQESKNKIKQMRARYGIEVKLWRQSPNP